MKRIRLLNILLLLLRTLFILLIVLLFAGPAIRINSPYINWTGTENVHLIMIDDSFSMRKSIKDSTLFRIAIRRAEVLIEQLNQSSKIGIMFLSNQGNIYWQESRKAAFQRISRSEPGYCSDAFGGVVEKANITAQKILKSGICNVIFFSDFTKHLINQVKGNLDTKPTGRTQWTFVNVNDGKKTLQLWTDSMDFPVQTSDPGGNLRAGLRIGGTDKAPIEVNAYLQGGRVWTKKISHESKWQKHSVLLPMRSKGFNNGKVVFQCDDNIKEDNTHYFTFWNPSRVSVLIISDSRRKMNYIKNALNLQGWGQNIFDMEFLNVKESLQKWRTGLYDVLWLCDLDAPSATLTSRLRDHLKKGRGVIISLGPWADIPAYNRKITGLLGLGRILPLPEIKNDQAYQTINELNVNDGLFMGFKRLIGEEIYIKRPLKLDPTPQAKIHAKLNSGSPFIVEANPYGGTILLINATLHDAEQSNIMRSGFFVPFTNRAILYVNKSLRQSGRYFAGHTVALSLENGEALRDPALIIQPGGETVKRALASILKKNRIEMNLFDKPGNYKMLLEGDDTTVISINIDPRESDISRASKSEIEELARQFGAEYINGLNHFETKARKMGRGYDLASAVIFMLLLVLLAESFVSNRMIQ